MAKSYKEMSRIIYIDKLNVLSCMAVVCLHSNGFVHTFIKDDWWWLRVLVETIFYFAVPVFFMLTGATLIEYRKRYSTMEFYRKRLQKTLIPFIFWGIVFYMLYYLIGHKVLGWKEIVTNITTGHIPLTNYWFFIPLFMIYLFMPFISMMVIHLSKNSLGVLCVLLIIFQTCLPTIYQICKLEFSVLCPIGGFIMFVLIGYYLSDSEIEKNKMFMAILGGGGLAALAIRYLLIYIAEERDGPLFTYMGFYGVVPAVYIFCASKRWRGNSKVWTWLSKKSFGVYLLHTALIMMFAKLYDMQHPLFVPIAFVLAYTISVVMTHILQKNFITRILVP